MKPEPRRLQGPASRADGQSENSGSKALPAESYSPQKLSYFNLDNPKIHWKSRGWQVAFLLDISSMKKTLPSLFGNLETLSLIAMRFMPAALMWETTPQYLTIKCPAPNHPWILQQHIMKVWKHAMESQPLPVSTGFRKLPWSSQQTFHIATMPLTVREALLCGSWDIVLPEAILFEANNYRGV